MTKGGDILEVEAGQENPWLATKIRTASFDADIQRERYEWEEEDDTGDKLDLPWDLVGVHRYVTHDREVEPVIVHYEDIAKKAMRCGTVLTSWETEMLMSKVDD